jgi:hypothetical protein
MQFVPFRQELPHRHVRVRQKEVYHIPVEPTQPTSTFERDQEVHVPRVLRMENLKVFRRTQSQLFSEFADLCNVFTLDRVAR